MEAIILEKTKFTELLNEIKDIKSAVRENPLKPNKNFITNYEFIELMGISKRTAQTWRDEGVIAFSQIGSKIYYQMDDIKKLLETNYFKTFKNNN